MASDTQEDPADPIAMVQSLFPGRILRIDAVGTDDSDTNDGETNDGETDDGETNDGETNDGDDSGAPATREQDPPG